MGVRYGLQGVYVPMLNKCPRALVVQTHADKLKIFVLPVACSLSHPKGDLAVLSLNPHANVQKVAWKPLCYPWSLPHDVMR